MRSCRHIRCSGTVEQRASGARCLGATRHESCAEINQNSFQPDSCGYTTSCYLFWLSREDSLFFSFTGFCDWLRISRKRFDWYSNCGSQKRFVEFIFFIDHLEISMVCFLAASNIWRKKYKHCPNYCYRSFVNRN